MAGAALGPGQHGLHFTLEVPGAEPLALALSRFAQDVTDFTPFWDGPFQTLWYSGRAQAFALGGEPGESLWPPLSEGYRRWKARHHPGRGPLVQSGRLKASMLGATAPGSIWRSRLGFLEVGTSVKSARGFSYPLAHQHGTSRMPARPPMAITPGVARATAKALQKFVVKAWTDRRRQQRLADKGIVITGSA